MAEMGGEGVQAMARLVLDCERAVYAVVDDVHAGEGKLGAYLVRDASEDRHLEKRALLVAYRRAGERAEVRDGVEGGCTRSFSRVPPTATAPSTSAR